MRDMARQMPEKAIGHPRTRPAEPIPVRAWIIDGRGHDVEVEGTADAWTRRAVHVQYFDEYGRRGAVWVWASAVARRVAL